MNNTSLRFEVLTEVLLNVQGFWDVTICCWVNSSRLFEGSYCLHLFDPDDKDRLRSFGMLRTASCCHSITSQKTWVFDIKFALRLNFERSLIETV
jgi:hypothetical protein